MQPIETAGNWPRNESSREREASLCRNENSFGSEVIQGGGAGIWLEIHYGHSRRCVSSEIRRLLPMRNSLPSTSTLWGVIPKATHYHEIRPRPGARRRFSPFGSILIRSRNANISCLALSYCALKPLLEV